MTSAELARRTLAARNHRRWCGRCGAELPPLMGQRGRPALYCAASTGRPCAALTKTIGAFRTEAIAVLGGASGAGRETALRALREVLRTLSQDLTLEAAELDGDVQRAAAVGTVDPVGFHGD